jgi:hypothetical protein
MHPSKLRPADIIAAAGGILLAISLFTASYKTSKNPNALINGDRGSFSAWDVHSLLRYVLLAAAIAPIILLYVILRDHKLSWPRGEMTAVIGIFALGLLFYNGVLDRPGEPSGQISLALGWFGMFVGALLIAAGGAMRSGESERRRKPPGVL